MPSFNSLKFVIVEFVFELLEELSIKLFEFALLSFVLVFSFILLFSVASFLLVFAWLVVPRAFATASIIPSLLYVAPLTVCTSVDWLDIISFIIVVLALLKNWSSSL